MLMFVIVSAMVGFDLYDNVWGKGAAVVIVGVLSYLLARRLAPFDMQTGLFYGAVWVVVGLILDAVVTVRFNPGIFATRALWIGYLLVILAPLVVAKRS